MNFSIDSIKEMMDGFDPAALLPQIDSIVDWVKLICRLAVLVGPVVLVLAGLSYLLLAPRRQTIISAIARPSAWAALPPGGTPRRWQAGCLPAWDWCSPSSC